MARFHAVSIILPQPIDYIVLRDDMDNIWKYEVASDGSLDISIFSNHPGRAINRRSRCVIPYASDHLYGRPHRQVQGYYDTVRNLSGIDRVPDYLTGVDENGVIAHLKPIGGGGEDAGELELLRISPAGLSYPMHDGFVMYGQTLGNVYTLTPHSQTVYASVLSDATIATEDVPIATHSVNAVISGVNYPNRLLEFVNISSKFEIGSLDEFGQTVSRSVANDISPIVIDNHDGLYDFMSNVYLRGRTVRAYEGDDDDPTQALTQFYSGVIDEVSWDRNTITLNVSNPSEEFKKPLQENIFAGTGGAEGTSIVKDRLKDIAFGAPIFFEPTLVDEVNYVYHLGDLQIAQIAATAPVLQVGQHAQEGFNEYQVIYVGDAYAWTPVLGWAALSQSQSLLRLGGEPTGVVTMALYGGLALANQYHRPGQIIEHIIYDRMGMIAGVNVDDDSIQEIKTNVLQDLRMIYFGNRAWAREEVLNDICKQFNGIWGFDANGLFYVKRLSLLDDPIDTFAQIDISPDGISRLDPGLLPGTLRYSFNPTVSEFNETDVVPGAEGYNRFRARTPKIIGSFTSQSGNTIPGLKTSEVDFLAQFSSDNDLCVADYSTEYMTPRDIYAFRLKRTAHHLRIGDVITLQYPRFGLQFGKSCILTRIGRDGRSGEADIECWG